MKIARILLISVCVCALLSFSFSQRTRQKPALKTMGADKIEQFLKAIQAAKSFEEMQAAFTQADFTPAELNQLKDKIEASPTLKQKIDQLFERKKAEAQPQIEEHRRIIAAKLQASKSQQIAEQKRVYQGPALQFINKCPANLPSVSRVEGTVKPGVEFAVVGKGLGSAPGSVDLMLPGPGRTYAALISSWNECGVIARLSEEITGVRASNEATLVLKRSDGKEARKVTSFQPLLEYAAIYDHGWCEGHFFGCSKDWYLNNFNLINDYFVYDRNFESVFDGNAKITFASPLNIPNGSARTDVHSGVAAFGNNLWMLHTFIAGPKGLPYK